MTASKRSPFPDIANFSLPLTNPGACCGILMKTAFLFCLGFCLFVLVPRTARAGQQDFTLNNNTGLDIAEVYVSPSEANDWEEDILGDESLGDGEEADIRFERSETAEKWDLKIVDEEGETVIWKGLNLLTAHRVTLLYAGNKPTAEVE